MVYRIILPWRSRRKGLKQAIINTVLNTQAKNSFETENDERYQLDATIMIYYHKYEGWNFNSGNYLFTTDTK